ncbi:MAG: DUF5107 domain-containing protein [Maribacter sp.]|uniref:DUF5107 domain-containing protein n=1 Tax=Maribacter sp. TaxID=1897614 RepID=UPI003C70E35A
MEVKAWKEIVTIPTYEIGEPEKNPIFLEKRVYQGSSGSVYPHPVVEKISDEKVDKEWTAIYLENNYLKIMILPELGGRVQMAYDKMKERHFVYYNQVIKPALVGLTGPWISGGIEFNWPQHHRPSTYDPVDFQIEENEDGSKTVWCSEVERMFRTKGMAGFTLHPDKAYLEIKVKLYNRTAQPQTFLWWANPAVKVNDHYQSVFPPDVNAVFDHGKRDVSEFPIAKGEYYKVDYSPGTDISKYKNIPVPTSYMAIQSDYDFVGGYENDSKGGMLHVANHHVSPGKKQWTWGNGEFGKAWDRNLTDEDGPYIELMCGVYTDNQPDFSWLMPYEEKSFSQYFIPYRDLGVVKNATKEAMLTINLENGKVVLKAFATSAYPNAQIKVEKGDMILMEDTFDFHPGVSYEKQFEIEPTIPLHELQVIIADRKGKVLVEWQAGKPEVKPIPEAARAVKEPAAIKSNEQLFLTGQHLEQYRHATFDPAAYYREALAREPGDIRSNNAMGLLLLRKGKFAQAQSHFEIAIATMTQRNPNPYDGEPYFNLGQALRYQGKDDEAYNAFHKSVWNDAWMASGYFQIAQLDCIRGNWELALENIDRALVRNWHNHKARHLKVIILRQLHVTEEAEELIKGSLQLDGFNFGVLYEKQLLTADEGVLQQFKSLIRDNMHTYIEYALDYAWAGQYQEAIGLLDLAISYQEKVYPMAHYYKGWMHTKSYNQNTAIKEFEIAEKCLPDYCFPNHLESVPALQNAIELNPKGSKANYYLGNFWYAARQVNDAVQCWERSIGLDPDFSIAQRNLALAYYNKLGKKEAALALMEKAFALDTSDARILMELDQLYKKLNYTHAQRVDFLTKYQEFAEKRDDTYLELVTLYNLTGQYEKALEMISSRIFHPWEGGEGKVSGQYKLSLVELAKKAIRGKDFDRAIQYLEMSKVYPNNLGEGKLHGIQENDIDYWLGCAYDGVGNSKKATEYWEQATKGKSEPTAAWFYNDPQPDMIFYQGLALLKLNRKAEANNRFNKLLAYGEKHLSDPIKIDYFAVSMPDLLIWEEDLKIRNQINCHYLIGLAYKGKGMNTESTLFFKKVLETDNSHIGVISNSELLVDF